MTIDEPATFTTLGIRVGWIEGNKTIIEKLANSGVIKSGGAVNNLMAGVILSFQIYQNQKLAHILNDLFSFIRFLVAQ